MLDNVACSRIAVGHMRGLSIKINYSLGKPFQLIVIISVLHLFLPVFEHTAKDMADTATDAVSCGVAWLHPYRQEEYLLCGDLIDMNCRFGAMLPHAA